MDIGDVVCVVFLFSPVIILGIEQEDIIEESLPDSGNIDGGDKIPFYRSVLELSGRQYIRFALKSGGNAGLLFSEKLANTINYNTDYDYIEFAFGGWDNVKTVIRIGTMSGDAGYVYTPGILDSTTFKYFWIGWESGMITLGHGFVIGDNVIIKKLYPSTIDIKYFGIYNGWGYGGDWKIYTGIYY